MDATTKYNSAFSRNIGWVTQEEQAALRTKCVAGVGGSLQLATIERRLLYPNL